MSAEFSDADKKQTTTPKPGNKPAWNALAAVFAAIFSIVLGQVFGGAAVWLTSAAVNTFTPFSLDSWLGGTGTQFLFVMYSAVFTLLVLWLFIGRRRSIGLSALGFGRRPRWLDLTYAVIGAGVYLAMFVATAMLAEALLGVNVNQEQEIGFEQAAGGAALALVFISLVVVPPVLEEVIFRGFLFGSLRQKLSLAWASLITSVLFAAPHILASSDGLLWIAAIDTFILSLVLCYLRERTGNLWAPIALHALKNGAAFTFLFVVL